MALEASGAIDGRIAGNLDGTIDPKPEERADRGTSEGEGGKASHSQNPGRSASGPVAWEGDAQQRRFERFMSANSPAKPSQRTEGFGGGGGS